MNTIGGPRDMEYREAYCKSREEANTTYLLRLTAKGEVCIEHLSNQFRVLRCSNLRASLSDCYVPVYVTAFHKMTLASRPTSDYVTFL